jgi:hypothetical protein
LNLEKTLQIIDKPSPELFEMLDDDLKINQYSLSVVKKYFDRHFGIDYSGNVEGLYFGQETCENLIPPLKNLQLAVEYCRQHEYHFVFATPYVGPKGMDRLRTLLSYLHKEAPGSEVSVNDYGVLHLLNTEFNNLKPVLGRLLVKLKRDPRFSISGYDITNQGIKNLKKVESNQLDALQGSSLELPVYQNFLRAKGIERICLDTLSQGMSKKTLKKWGFPVDLIWPWSYITSGRSCSIAAHTQPGKEFHPTDEPCKFQCKKYEFTFSSDKKMMPALFRGNAAWMSTQSMYEEFFDLGFDRLVYEPYIPV